MSVSTRAPAKHVHAGDKHTSLATNMEYYDMCGADKTTDLKWKGVFYFVPCSVMSTCSVSMLEYEQITSSADEACDRF